MNTIQDAINMLMKLLEKYGNIEITINGSFCDCPFSELDSISYHDENGKPVGIELY